jgi:beta-lactamase class A
MEQNLSSGSKRKTWRWTIAAFIFLAGFFVGWFECKHFGLNKETAGAGPLIIREAESGYQFIGPLLAVGDFPELRGYQGLEDKIRTIINEQEKTQKITAASVYLRDFNSGQWLGIGENEQYAPASMYKVALMITCLKIAEKDNSFLKQEIIYYIDPQKRTAAAEPDSPRIELGKPYSVAELIRRLIIYSDNDAKSMLGSVVDVKTKEEVFSDLGLIMPDLNEDGDSMSPKQYALFFRILFNASYLSRSASEAALDLLGATSFKGGLVAGVPENISVAHKYGYRNFKPEDKNNEQELHDCGIVYHPDHPYFLCVMTKGNNYENLQAVIQQVSHVAYESMAEKYK